MKFIVNKIFLEVVEPKKDKITLGILGKNGLEIPGLMGVDRVILSSDDLRRLADLVDSRKKNNEN